MIYTACNLYSNQTAHWNYGSGSRVLVGSSAEVREFPWMVYTKKKKKNNNLTSYQFLDSEKFTSFYFLCKGCSRLHQRTIKNYFFVWRIAYI